jgi:hypothetical protein
VDRLVVGAGVIALGAVVGMAIAVIMIAIFIAASPCNVGADAIRC